MTRRRILAAGSFVWAFTGATIAAMAFASLENVSRDARVVLALASIAFPLCALGATLAPLRNSDRLAGLLLLLSVATPTYFAYAVNLPALVIGVALIVSPRVTVGHASAV